MRFRMFSSIVLFVIGALAGCREGESAIAASGISAVAATSETVVVKLFDKDYEKDPSLASYEADDYVEHPLPPTATALKDTIELLLATRLSHEYRDPNQAKRRRSFRLVDAEVGDGKAVLTFEDPFHFTSGGSARVTTMRNQIVNTALQFRDVDEVVILPEDLFQP